MHTRTLSLSLFCVKSLTIKSNSIVRMFVCCCCCCLFQCNRSSVHSLFWNGLFSNFKQLTKKSTTTTTSIVSKFDCSFFFELYFWLFVFINRFHSWNKPICREDWGNRIRTKVNLKCHVIFSYTVNSKKVFKLFNSKQQLKISDLIRY